MYYVWLQLNFYHFSTSVIINILKKRRFFLKQLNNFCHFILYRTSFLCITKRKGSKPGHLSLGSICPLNCSPSLTTYDLPPQPLHYSNLQGHSPSLMSLWGLSSVKVQIIQTDLMSRHTLHSPWPPESCPLWLDIKLHTLHSPWPPGSCPGGSAELPHCWESLAEHQPPPSPSGCE